MGDARRPHRRASSALKSTAGSGQAALAESLGGQVDDTQQRLESENPSNPVDRFPSSKIAIPRTAAPGDQSSTIRRVGHACEPCRDQKTKCSGDRPTCRRCLDLGITCSYGDRKRERTAKQLRGLTKQVQDYETLLNTLQSKLIPQDMHLVQETLSRYRIDGDKSGADNNPIPSGTPEGAFSRSPVHTVLTGLLGGVDYTEEDFNRNAQSQAMGFVGQHSETSWIYNLKREIEDSSPALASISTTSTTYHQDRHSVASVSYFLDDAEIPLIEDVDPFAWPPQAIANEFMNVYFNTVHSTFPIVGKETFIGQYKSFYSTPFVRPGQRWLAILNLIYAIAARYFQQLQSDRIGPDNNDLVYFSRARRLSMGDGAIIGHPDLQQVQVEGLTSFYLLCIGHVNRSWRVCGMSIRSAVAMGLNLRSESEYITHVSKEARYRVWWSLYTLETTLCNMTGRPFGTHNEFCTTPLPVPFEEGEFGDGRVTQIMADNKVRSPFVEQFASRRATEPVTSRVRDHAIRGGNEVVTPNESLYFLHLVDLTMIVREAIGNLYAPGDAQKPSCGVETVITDLNTKADEWLSGLPGVFQFSSEQQTQAFERQRLSLALLFYSAKILICKPYLHHPGRQSAGNGSEGFGEGISTICIRAACKMLDLLPDDRDTTWLFQISPWWCVLHYLLQATMVLLIELSFKARLGLQDPDEILEKASKATSWLRQMSAGSLSCQRAWCTCGELLSQLAQRFET